MSLESEAERRSETKTDGESPFEKRQSTFNIDGSVKSFQSFTHVRGKNRLVLFQRPQIVIICTVSRLLYRAIAYLINVIIDGESSYSLSFRAKFFTQIFFELTEVNCGLIPGRFSRDLVVAQNDLINVNVLQQCFYTNVFTQQLFSLNNNKQGWMNPFHVYIYIDGDIQT